MDGRTKRFAGCCSSQRYEKTKSDEARHERGLGEAEISDVRPASQRITGSVYRIGSCSASTVYLLNPDNDQRCNLYTYHSAVDLFRFWPCMRTPNRTSDQPIFPKSRLPRGKSGTRLAVSPMHRGVALLDGSRSGC